MTDPPGERIDLAQVVIRLVEPPDHAEVYELFNHSILEGQISDNDTGADIANLDEGYFRDDGASGFWVAVHDGRVIGMIGVQRTRESTAEVRRLRVRDAYRRKGVGTMLTKHAVDFCRQHGYLKVILDVRIERGPAISLFEKCGFTHGGTREIGDRKVLDFFLNLYKRGDIGP